MITMRSSSASFSFSCRNRFEFREIGVRENRLVEIDQGKTRKP